MKIRKDTYGSYERPCIYLIDEESHSIECIQYCEMTDADIAKEYLNIILARLEYCVKNNINISIDGFRTDKDKYPNG